jgi:hypothetical protein
MLSSKTRGAMPARGRAATQNCGSLHSPKRIFLEWNCNPHRISTLARVQHAERFNAASIVVCERRVEFPQMRKRHRKIISSFSNQLFEDDLLRQIALKTIDAFVLSSLSCLPRAVFAGSRS